MSTFLEKLADAPRSRTSSEHLKLLGKRAAGLFTKGEVNSLTEAVSQVVSEEESLTRDQVQRISEMANQSAWNEKFHQGGDRETHFDPADSNAVLESLSEKAVSIKEPNLDYALDPPKEDVPDVDLGELWGVKNSDEYPQLNPTGEIEGTRENVKAAAEQMRWSVDRLGVALGDAGEEFYQLVKQAHLKYDHGIVQIAKAINLVCDSPAFVDEIMKTAAERLKSEGVRINPQTEMLKMAEAVVVDTDHPLLVAAAKFEKTAQAYHKAAAAKKGLENEHRRVDTFLRDKLRGV